MLFIRLNPFRHHIWFTIHKLKMSSVVGISVEIFFYVLTLEVLPSCGPFWKTDTIYETFEIIEGQRNFEEIVFDFVANLVATTRPFVQQLVKAYIETSKPLKFCTWHDSCAPGSSTVELHHHEERSYPHQWLIDVCSQYNISYKICLELCSARFTRNHNQTRTDLRVENFYIYWTR